MVSRYGVSKEGAVGVAVGVGPMHCPLPHCGGPHHHHHLSAPHPQNPQPGHNHHVHPAHQPSPSPSPHLNHQLSHHQLTVNINHLSHQQQQQQQTQHQQAPPQYRVVTANARSDFHVSGQNYGTQPGGQVGGGGGSVGVPGGRGPPPLGGLQSIGQSAAGIPPGGPAGGQAPPQTPAPGVQSQQPQGPAPTTTPPVHTPSPQEMGKQAHLQPQPQPLSQVYGPTQTRPTSQGYYPGPRPQQPRGISHRGGQGGTGAQVVGMSGVGGGGGQPTAIYHPGGLPVQTGAMYQVPNLHPSPHQQSLYAMNSQIPLQFGGPPQRHQTHQNHSYFPPLQHSAIITAQNMFGYGAPAPTPQPYYWSTGQPANAPLSISRAGASAVTGGAQHVAGPLAGAQGAPVVPQGTLQQPTQQAQPLPPIGISLSQTDVYSGHNGGAGTTNSMTKSRKPRGQNAITDIVDPSTGKNISHEIYKDNETIQSGESSNRETPQLQNNDAEVQADFAARVAKTLAKVATEESNSDSTVPTCVPNTSTTQNVTQSLSNSQINSNTDVNSQCSTSSPATQNVPNVTALCSQSLGTTNNVAQVDSCTVKTESKPLQIPVKEFQPRGEIKSVVIEEPPPPASRNVNKDDISPQLLPTTVTEVEVKSTSVPSTATQTSAPLMTIVPSTNVPEIPKPSATAPSANPVPARELFPNLSNKNSSSSPPRRKSQTYTHNQSVTTTELPSSAKEQKEKKTREKSLSSRGTTPTPASNQTDHHLKTNGDATADKPEPEAARTEVQQQKSSDGKVMQKQKSKNKLKPRELNRKGAEKEGTDMDAFVNTIPPAKTDAKQDIKEPLPTKDSNKEASREITKEIKEKDNYESKKEKEISSSVHAKLEKHVTPSTPEIPKESSTTPVQTPVIEKLTSNKETVKEPSPKIEDTNKSNACNVQAKPVPNDVVDHAIVKEESDVEAIVAQKNEENSKVSAARVPSSEDKPLQASPVIEKTAENESPAQSEATTPVTNQITLKYKYKGDQWSPINKTGKKVYDREFLIRLQDDPNSKIKPANLPDLDVVLKDSSKARTASDLRPFKDANMSRHDNLYPVFTKSLLNARVPPTSRNKSHSGGKSSKPTKPNVIHVSLSLREDVKLRETENAWKPTRLKPTALTEEQTKTEALYKRVRSVLNKLTPQKFNTLVDQVRALNIDTPERLQGVINLVFEKAVDEPSFSVAYALMCKELAMMEVSGSDKNSEKQECSFSFKKLIITRCQNEFEKNPVNEVARAARLKKIDECTDPERKKDLQLALEEEERRIRIKSVGNIRFIGELYKQGMLTTKIMHRCIQELLNQNDEDSLECLCKLLTTIGKDLETKGPAEEMEDYFNKMQNIVSRRNQGKISSRIRFMLQDVIDLKANKWVPRRDESNPKTIDQIQKEAESERLDSQLSNTPLNTPRKDERTNDRKRNRGVGPTDESGWSQPIRARQPYSVETAKLKNKPPPMDDLQLGSRHMFLWKATPSSCGSKAMNSNKFACLENMSTLDQDKRMPSPQLSGSRSTGPREYGRDYKPSYDGRSSRNGSHQLSSSSSLSRESSLLDSSQSQSVSMPPPLKSSQSTSNSHKPPMNDDEFMKVLNKILKDYLKNFNIEKAASAIQQNFDNALSKFMRELINFVLEKSPVDREHVSHLMSHLISQKILPFQHLRNGFIEILELVDDLLLDIPKVWSYLAEVLAHPIENDILPLSELKPIFDSLRSRGYVGRLFGELLSKISRDKGPKWVADKWDQSGLQLSNLIDPELEKVDKIIKDYNLEFCTGDYNSAKSSTSNQLALQQIHNELRKFMKESSFDVICNWIIATVGNRVKEPEFIRVLTTAILETSMEPANNRWNLKTDVFINLQQLIRRFVDANESLELQCLYAIQLHLHNLQYPHGILFNIMTSLSDYNIISSDAFMTWKKTPEPAQREWHGVATMALTSFFTGLQEADDASSVEDVSTGVNQDRC